MPDDAVFASVLAVTLAVALDVAETVAATVETPPPAAGADTSLVGVVSVVTYGDSTGAGFFIDTIDSPFDVFTVFEFKYGPRKSTLRVLSTSYEFWSHSIVVCGLFDLTPNTFTYLSSQTVW